MLNHLVLKVIGLSLEWTEEFVCLLPQGTLLSNSCHCGCGPNCIFHQSLDDDNASILLVINMDSEEGLEFFNSVTSKSFPCMITIVTLSDNKAAQEQVDFQTNATPQEVRDLIVGT